MDNAVALVEAYLRVNGYLTVAEYPVVEAGLYGSYQTRTDIDIIGFRFPGAGRLVSGVIERRGHARRTFAPDPALECDGEHADMLIGEVKEGRSDLNPAIHDPAVLQAALARFGCSPGDVAARSVQALLSHGSTVLPSGHQVRMAVFGSVADSGLRGVALQVSMGHIVDFLEQYIGEYWQVLRHSQFKDPAFGFLVTLEKARRGNTAEHDGGDPD